MSLFKRDGARRRSPEFGESRAPKRRPVEHVDLDSLLALVAESRGFACEFARDGAAVTLRGPLDGDTPLVVRLTGLRREAGRRAREDWPVLVSEHLAHAVATAGEQVDVCDLEQAGPLLRVRVESVDEVGDLTKVVGRHLNADLVELLIVGSRPVRPEEAGCWPVPTAHALDLAVRNVREDERLLAESIELSGTPVTRLTARTPSAATHLRWLGDYLQVPGDGVLAVLPDPYTLLVHPVDGIGVVRAIERLRVHALTTDGLSPQVYWWHEGRLTLIRADIIVQQGQTRLVVAPPPEFAQVLARLAV
ncbi:hypothetical protein [Nonomuraea turcica]|uniref:hypothetical protein n=1 Tax=Nonomuraea sp. G32 TaxID=3067274 RepID=UPI00273BA41C|nr:hypothetical protein [Nonomuraea sp. G32]MDP4507740.1 hypothetical protein [Nonomuraea sp. G32]